MCLGSQLVAFVFWWLLSCGFFSVFWWLFLVLSSPVVVDSCLGVVLSFLSCGFSCLVFFCVCVVLCWSCGCRVSYLVVVLSCLEVVLPCLVVDLSYLLSSCLVCVFVWSLMCWLFGFCFLLLSCVVLFCLYFLVLSCLGLYVRDVVSYLVLFWIVLYVRLLIAAYG